MKHLVISFIAAVVGILAAQYFIAGFQIAGGWAIIAELALILAIINISIKPFLTFIFKPLIILTLGVFYVVISAILLWFVAYYFTAISFASTTDLIYTSIILSLVNAIFNSFI